ILGVLYALSSPGVPLPATSVTLWAHTAGRTYIRLGSTPTGSDGSYSFTQMPSHNETYRVRTTYIPPPRRKTAQVFEGAADVVSLTASSTTSTVGGEVTSTGTGLAGQDGSRHLPRTVRHRRSFPHRQDRLRRHRLDV